MNVHLTVCTLRSAQRPLLIFYKAVRVLNLDCFTIERAQFDVCRGATLLTSLALHRVESTWHLELLLPRLEYSLLGLIQNLLILSLKDIERRSLLRDAIGRRFLELNALLVVGTLLVVFAASQLHFIYAYHVEVVV